MDPNSHTTCNAMPKHDRNSDDQGPMGRRRAVLADQRCEDRVSVPVHHRRQINVHIEDEREGFLLEVAV